MKKKLIKIFAISTIFFASSATADLGGFYGVIGFQQSNADENLSALTQMGLPSSDDDGGVNFGLGYEYNKYIAVELGFVDLGNVLSIGQGTFNDGGGGGPVSGSYAGIPYSYTAGAQGDLNLNTEVEGFTLGGLFSYPFTEKASVYAKAGVYFWDMETTGSGEVTNGNLTINGTTYNSGFGAFTTSVSDDGNDLFYGVGLEYDFTDAMSVRADYTAYEAANIDIDAYGAALKINF